MGFAAGSSPPAAALLLTALASIPSYVPTVAQIMASRSAHTEEREEMEGEAAREGGERWEGREGGGREGEANCMCRERKRILKKGKGGADRDNEKGKRREQKASAIRRGRRMRNACAGGRCVGCVRRGACVCVCATACMRVSVLAGRRLEGRRRSALRQ